MLFSCGYGFSGVVVMLFYVELFIRTTFVNETIPVPGQTIAAFLRKNGKLSAGARLGVEKRAGKGWEQVSLKYRVQDGDRIRVKAAKGSARNALGLTALARAIVLSQKR
jgi:hypothetical protein